MESYSKTRYHALRSMGRCVSCKTQVSSDKSRCPACMKALEESVKKSKRKRLSDMENRIKELEAMLNV